mmetsp:Transcript_60607/g.179680  ORF Transcript_60607/g.179680 Transcript_60607/m.179680 type:complete len:145 (-) Transcript_60607:723-1157(-)
MTKTVPIRAVRSSQSTVKFLRNTVSIFQLFCHCVRTSHHRYESGLARETASYQAPCWVETRPDSPAMRSAKFVGRLGCDSRSSSPGDTKSVSRRQATRHAGMLPIQLERMIYYVSCGAMYANRNIYHQERLFHTICSGLHRKQF